MSDSNMSTQGLLDEFKKIIDDKFKSQPTTPPASGLSPLLTLILSLTLSVLISIAAAFGIKPTPLPFTGPQAQPAVVVVSVPQGSEIASVKK